MKLIIFVLLTAGPFVVWGQQQSSDPLFRAIPLWRPDPPPDLFKQLQPPFSAMRQGSPGTALLLAMTQPKVRVMAPDRMPCWVPDLTRVGRMPVSHSQNADKMPNPLTGKKKAEK